jgi:hypothetical protein
MQTELIHEQSSRKFSCDLIFFTIMSLRKVYKMESTLVARAELKLDFGFQIWQ